MASREQLATGKPSACPSTGTIPPAELLLFNLIPRPLPPILLQIFLSPQKFIAHWRLSVGGLKHLGHNPSVSVPHPSVKQWRVGRRQPCHGTQKEEWSWLTCIFITHAQLGGEGRWRSSGPYFVSLRKKRFLGLLHHVSLEEFSLGNANFLLGVRPITASCHFYRRFCSRFRLSWLNSSILRHWPDRAGNISKERMQFIYRSFTFKLI